MLICLLSEITAQDFRPPFVTNWWTAAQVGAQFNVFGDIFSFESIWGTVKGVYWSRLSSASHLEHCMELVSPPMITEQVSL